MIILENELAQPDCLTFDSVPVYYTDILSFYVYQSLYINYLHMSFYYELIYKSLVKIWLKTTSVAIYAIVILVLSKQSKQLTLNKFFYTVLVSPFCFE